MSDSVTMFRYLVLVSHYRPLDRLSPVKLRLMVILGIWSTGLILAGVQYKHCEAKLKFNLLYNTTYYQCIEDWDVETGKLFTWFIFAATFAVPMIILIYTYGRMGYAIYTYREAGGQEHEQQLPARSSVAAARALGGASIEDVGNSFGSNAAAAAAAEHEIIRASRIKVCVFSLTFQLV